MAVPGQLIVHPVCAELYRDVEAFGRMDPYCVVTVGSNQERTAIAENAGKYPNWSNHLTFQIFNEESIRVQVWDRRHMVGDEEIGSAEVIILNARQMGQVEESVELFHHGRGVGKVRLSIRFQPQYAQPMYPPQGQPYGYPQEVIIEGGHHHHHPHHPQEVIIESQGYGQPPREIIIEEGRHHHHHNKEYIIEGGYPQPGFPPQPGYPPQQGYPPQPGYPPYGGYPPQGGYPPY